MERLVLCRPLGGLNDTLCRIALCLQFAERTERSLIIDTRDSGLMGEFDHYLVFRHDTTPVRVVTAVSDDLLLGLDSSACYPEFLNRDISVSNFMALSLAERREYARSVGVGSLRTDLVHDYSENLIFYEGGGGGVASFDALKHLTVSDSITQILRDFSQTLPSRYLGAHVRATDYRADAEYFLKKLRGLSPRIPVYLATDNQEVFDNAVSLFRNGRVFNNPPDSPLEAGQPKHRKGSYDSESDMRRATERMFQDLFGLAGASRLYYPLLDQSTTEHGLPKASGFSRLARHLAEKPELFASFFLTPRPTTSPPWPGARILAPLQAQWVYWKHGPFRHFPDSLKPRGRLKVILDGWRGFGSI